MSKKTSARTRAETAERTALAGAWLRWNGRAGTNKQIGKITLSLEMLRRICAVRGISAFPELTSSIKVSK
tara:strand:+ start:9276 stop:9485 length:210 start_codon:yes stop_codon:yes gene_type:complete